MIEAYHDGFVSVRWGQFIVVSLMTSDYSLVGNIRKLCILSHGHRSVPTVTKRELRVTRCTSEH